MTASLNCEVNNETLSDVTAGLGIDNKFIAPLSHSVFDNAVKVVIVRKDGVGWKCRRF